MVEHAMPRHPTTGMAAIGFTRRGPVWPIAGASEDPPTNPPPNQPDPPAPPPPDPDMGGDPGEDPPDETVEELLGKAGVKSLLAEREAHKATKALLRAEREKNQQRGSQQDAQDPDTADLAARVDELQTALDAEVAARRSADEKAAAAELAALRGARAAEKGLPAVLARKLVGATAEEIDTEIDELLPLLAAPRPTPNPQQGAPSLSRGGSLSAGRERYAANHR